MSHNTVYIFLRQRTLKTKLEIEYGKTLMMRRQFVQEVTEFSLKYLKYMEATSIIHAM